MRATINDLKSENASTTVNKTYDPANVTVVLDCILERLNETKAQQIVSIHIADRSSIADYMVIASGRSDRHVGAIAEQVRKKLKELGCDGIRIEGLEVCDWVLIDCGSVIVHVFRPEVREFYNLEKMWTVDWSAIDNTN